MLTANSRAPVIPATYDSGMWLRQAYYRWLFPAAVVLPLWLLLGWGIFGAGAWALLWVLFIAIPSVLVGQTILTLLVRSRPSVRATRAVSWWDVAGFTVWHVLTVVVGCYPRDWFGLALTAAILVAVLLFWLMLVQLWNEAKGSGFGLGAQLWSPVETAAPARDHTDERQRDVYVIRETPGESPR